MINGSSVTCHHLPAGVCVPGCVTCLYCMQLCAFLKQIHTQMCVCIHRLVCPCLVMCVCQKPHWPHRPAWPSTISTGANSGSRLQLNIHPRGQLSGRKQTHLWWPGLCGGMTYAPTCQMSLARFDSPGRVAPLPVHYVLIRIIVLSECKCWLLFHGSTGRRFAQMKSKLMSQLFTLNYLSVITPQRTCRASLPIFSQAFLFNLTSTSHLDAAHCDHSFLLPSCRELSALL